MIKAVLKDDKVIGIVEVPHEFKGFLMQFNGRKMQSVGMVVSKSQLTKKQKIHFNKLLEENDHGRKN